LSVISAFLLTRELQFDNGGALKYLCCDLASTSRHVPLTSRFAALMEDDDDTDDNAEEIADDFIPSTAPISSPGIIHDKNEDADKNENADNIISSPSIVYDKDDIISSTAPISSTVNHEDDDDIISPNEINDEDDNDDIPPLEIISSSTHKIDALYSSNPFGT